MSTLSLTIIVNKGEAFELNRCLESLKGNLIDEIIITQTFEDDEVKKVAEKFNAKLSFFKWINDFSAARNFNLSQATCDYVLWLDADDVVKSDNYNKLLLLKSQLHLHDMYHIPYIYWHTDEDKPHNVHPRERIFKNKDSRFKWQDAIHEYITYDSSVKIKHITDIFIDHYRMKPYAPYRNLTILKEQYLKSPSSRIKFYYGKELFDIDEFEKAVPILLDLVKTSEGNFDNLAASCIRLSKYYFSQKLYDKVKSFSLQGISFSNNYAELYYYYADACWNLNEIDNAIKFFELALTKKFGFAGFTQEIDYYGLKPANNLSLLYYHKKNDYLKSLKYNLISLKSSLSESLLNDLKLLLTYHVKIKIVWLIPYFDINFPSTRIRRKNISDSLNNFGIKSEIITNYYSIAFDSLVRQLYDFDVIIFTQHNEIDFRLIKHFKNKNKIFDFCEALFDSSYLAGCFSKFDKIVCCSTKLAEMTNEKGYSNTVVIKDAIEKKIVDHKYSNSGKLKAVYMGMGGNAELVDKLRAMIEFAGYELIIISEWEIATIKWDLNTWHEELNKCDVVLCPQRPNQPAKSNVKVTTAMSLGLPVIASASQAYNEVIKNGVNGYLCLDENDWLNALNELKSENKRQLIGENAKKSLKDYSIENISVQWIQLLYDLNESSLSKNTKLQNMKENEMKTENDSVDIIIPNYNNSEYLKLCVDSIIKNTDGVYRIIVSDAGSNDETWNYLNSLIGVTVIGNKDKRLNYSQACNEGILKSYSKYFVILNSDVILSKGWLSNLINKMNTVPRLAACGVLSNCDRGWLNNVNGRPSYNMRLESGIELVPAMKIGQFNIDDLYNFMEKSNIEHKDKYTSQPWVAVYATMFARSAINEVGLFDINFKNGCEDLDLCVRLKKYNYEIGQAIDSFVFHFGGVSRGSYELEHNTVYREEDIYNHKYYKNKYEKERVIIYTGPAFERWNKTKVMSGMAGSETWATELASALSTKGFHVTVYNDLDIEDIGYSIIEKDGEVYRHYSKLNEDIQYSHIDYFISSRSCDIYSNNIHCLNKYVMIHDIWLSQDANYDTKSWQVKKFAVLSDWHKEFVLSHHKSIPNNKIMLTANGKNLNEYKNVDKIEKKNRIFYSSSLDRGLLILLRMFPQIRKAIPDLELVIAYGLFNWEQAIKARGNLQHELDHINEIKELMKQPGVNYVGRLSKVDLANIQMTCKAWLYPTWFWETFCITAVDAGLSKCAIVCSNLAGLKTTIGDAGVLIDGDSNSKEYQDRFIQESIKVLSDDKYSEELANKAYNKVIEYSWDKIADDWINEFKGINKVQNKGLKKLNLGCGGKKIEGYIGVDIFKGANVDEVFSMDKIPYDDSTIDGIYSEHSLEHLMHLQAIVALKEWYRVLKVGADLILKIPDLEQCCQYYLNPPEHILKRGVSLEKARAWFKYTIFGYQKSLSGEPDEAQIHRTGFSKQEITDILKQIGFNIISIENYDGYDTPSIEIKALK